MIMAGYEFMDKKPFGNVYFTGIIRDAIGRKMSKSLGNSPDPLELIAKYGADGLRFGLMLIAPQGQDILFDEKRCEVGRNFMNKLWNAARFIQMQRATPKHIHEISAHNDKIRYELNEAVKSVDKALNEYRFNEAAKTLFEFVWRDFCDWYVEATKFLPNQPLLEEVFQTILKLLHPFAPFITEELWHSMGYGTDTIQLASWPKLRSDREMTDLGATPQRAQEVDKLYELITAGRRLRSDYGIDPKKEIDFVIQYKLEAAYFPTVHAEIMRFLGAKTITPNPNDLPKGVPCAVTSTATIFMVGAVDVEAERQRLTGQLADIERQLAATDAKLANENFVSKAAPIAVQRERDKQQQLREQREKIQALLRALQ
jgi:valyl-tRNA synthetase